MAVPPAPALIVWYQHNRLMANFSLGYTMAERAANDRLWLYLIEHEATPPPEWLERNNFEAVEKPIALPKPAKPAKSTLGDFKARGARKRR